MTELWMRPAAVTGSGSAAQWIGRSIVGEHRHVRSAGDDGMAAGLAGFSTYGALSSYADLFDGVVRSVGDDVHGTGSDLMSTANIVSGTDASSASVVSASGGSIRDVNLTEVAV